jgi:molybdenum cofactor cytidylyltransferase
VTRPVGAGRTVAGIVLAAGASRRLGRPKALLVLAGRTLLARAVAAQLEAGLDPVVVVLGHAAEEVRAAAGLPPDPRLCVVVNPGWEEGMASSLRSGLEVCGNPDAVVVALADQPDTDSARVRAVVEAWDGQAPLVVPIGDGRSSHPVLFARAVYGELRALRGDIGGRAIVERHRDAAIRVPLAALLDVDTEDDYRAALDRAARPDGGKKLT